MAIPVPLRDCEALFDYKERTRCREDLCELAGQAIRSWLKVQTAKEKAGRRGQATKGYQWKQLFLPNGTVLRVVIEGRNYQATVKRDRIIFDGKAVSPSQFANPTSSSRRNAWNRIWLLFPGAAHWRRASACREPSDIARRSKADENPVSKA